jgi:multimeric flavodoxin WrbA
MDVLTILGSPRRRGNTATVLGWFEEQVGVHHVVERVNLPRASVKGCLGCDACQRTLDAPGCVQRDVLSERLEQVLHADLVVYASPVYVWGFTAQMKALLDRHVCMVKWQDGAKARALLAGKPAALLTTCGGGAEENADLIEQIFRREMAYLECPVVGAYAVPHCSQPSELGDPARQVASQMASDVLAALLKT